MKTVLFSVKKTTLILIISILIFSVNSFLVGQQYLNTPVNSFLTKAKLNRASSTKIKGNSVFTEDGKDSYRAIQSRSELIDKLTGKSHQKFSNQSHLSKILQDKNIKLPLNLLSPHTNPITTIAQQSNYPIVQPTWIEKFGAETAPSFAQPTELVVDDYGNVFVSGIILRYETSIDIMLIKYDTNGNEQWRTEYGGSDSTDDRPIKMIVDKAGNVLLIASINGGINNTYGDWAILSYSKDGQQRWVRIHNENEIHDTFAVDMAIDINGMSYVMGVIHDSSYNLKSLVVKYDTLGNIVWKNIIDETIGVSINLDSEANTYIFATSTVDYLVYDTYIIKYNSNGSQVWLRKMEDDLGYYHYPTSLVIDKNGDIYALAELYKPGSTRSFTLHKYNKASNFIWSSYSDSIRMHTILLQNNDRPILIGQTVETPIHQVVQCYKSEGDIAWMIKDDSTLDSIYFQYYTSIPPFSATDSVGNLFIGGANMYDPGEYQIMIISYDASGKFRWSQLYRDSEKMYSFMNNLKVIKNGSLFISAGFTSYGMDADCGTIKYSPEGNLLWMKRYIGPPRSDDHPKAFTVDTQGNLYVLATSAAKLGYDDFLTIKYDKMGILQWSRRYDGGRVSQDDPVGIVVDTIGNVYVSGYSRDMESFNSRITTIKYGSDGSELWIAHYGEYQHLGAQSIGIGIDENSFIYIAGIIFHKGPIDEFRTINTAKYNSEGVELWQSEINFPDAYPEKITVNQDGFTYIGGTVGYDSSANIFLLKLNPLGQESWRVQYDGTAHRLDRFMDQAIDRDGNVIIAGYSKGDGTSYDCVTLNYNSAGNIRWLNSFNGKANGWDFPEALDVDKHGNIIVGCITFDSAFQCTSMILKYDSAGNQLWEKEITPTQFGANYLFDVAADNNNDVFIFSTILDDLPQSQCLIGKFNGIGDLEWLSPLISNNGSLMPIAIEVDNEMNLYAASSISGGWESSKILLLKYSTQPQIKITIYDTLLVGWNLVSLPVLGLLNREVSAVFPATQDNAFYFDQTYQITQSLNILKGYWVKSSKDTIIVMAGSPFTKASISVKRGWNLIGSISETVQVDLISSDPPGISTSDFYGYDSAIDIVNIIQPGKGYWIKVDLDGDLLLSSSIPSNPANRIKIVLKEGKPPQPPGKEENTQLLIPTSFALEKNYPNPFNPTTIFKYQLPTECKVQLVIYNVLGQIVATIVDEVQSAGYKSATFDGSNLSSGIYFVRMNSGSYNDVKKIVLAK